MTDPVVLFLVVIASLLLVGALGELLFSRTRIPEAIWLIGTGLVLRMTGVVPDTVLETITPYFAVVTLVIVLFEGGSRLSLGELARDAPRATLMSVTAFFGAVITVTLFSLGLSAIGVLPEWSLRHGVMLGAILGGTSSLILGPSLDFTGSDTPLSRTIHIESSLNDALCVMLAIPLIDLLATGGSGDTHSAVAVLKSVGIGLGLGTMIGWTWIPILRVLGNNPRGYPITLAALLMVYAIVRSAGGSPAMAILAFALIVGNARVLMRWFFRGAARDNHEIRLSGSIKLAHSQINFIVKTLFFTYMGLMLTPPWSLLIMGVVLGVLLLVTRWPAVGFGLRGTGFHDDDRRTAMICCPRGMAAGALATMPALAGVPGTENLHSLVFSTIATSIVLFTIGFRQVRGTWPQPTPRPVAPLPEPSADLITAARAAELDLDEPVDPDHHVYAQPIATRPIAQRPVAPAPVVKDVPTTDPEKHVFMQILHTPQPREADVSVPVADTPLSPVTDSAGLGESVPTPSGPAQVTENASVPEHAPGTETDEASSSSPEPLPIFLGDGPKKPS